MDFFPRIEKLIVILTNAHTPKKEVPLFPYFLVATNTISFVLVQEGDREEILI